MTSEMFMLWVKEKLCPCFENKYPGKKMVLITNNAPYHCAREIGSLSSTTKKGILDLYDKYDVDYMF